MVKESETFHRIDENFFGEALDGAVRNLIHPRFSEVSLVRVLVYRTALAVFEAVETAKKKLVPANTSLKRGVNETCLDPVATACAFETDYFFSAVKS